MIDRKDIEEISESATKDLLATALRQALIFGASALLPHFVAEGGVLEAIAAGAVLLVTIGYGLIRARLNRKRLVRIARTDPRQIRVTK